MELLDGRADCATLLRKSSVKCSRLSLCSGGDLDPASYETFLYLSKSWSEGALLGPRSGRRIRKVMTLLLVAF